MSFRLEFLQVFNVSVLYESRRIESDLHHTATPRGLTPGHGLDGRRAIQTVSSPPA